MTFAMGGVPHAGPRHFASKEQVSFNFMVAVTICSDFGAPQNNLPLVSLKHLVPLRLGGCKSHVAGLTYTGGLDNLQSSP